MGNSGRKVRQRHNQIVNALKSEARSRGADISDVYNQFFREVFLNELMQEGEGWVLKGGTNVYCRIPGARQTKDLDIYHDFFDVALMATNLSVEADALRLRRSVGGI